MASKEVINGSCKFPESLDDVSDYLNINEVNTWLAVLFVFLTPFIFNVVSSYLTNVSCLLFVAYQIIGCLLRRNQKAFRQFIRSF